VGFLVSIITINVVKIPSVLLQKPLLIQTFKFKVQI